MTSTTQPPVTPPVGDSADISLFALLTPLVRRWKLVLGTAFAFAVVAAVALLLTRPVYRATTTFTPENSGTQGLAGSLAGLAGLAGQLGVGSGGTGASTSPEFFQRLLQSRELLDATLRTPFAVPDSPGVSRPLLDILVPADAAPARRRELGEAVLRRRIKATPDKTTGIVTLDVEMPGPALAAQVANRLVAQLNQFNLERRQSQSRAQREFTEGRLKVAESELRDAEQQQEAFLARNRAYSESPLLTFEAQRLDRAVRVRQEVYLTLRKSFEEARISEVRDTPVLTVIDTAVAPVRRDRPKRALGTIVAAMAGLVVGVIMAYAASVRARVRRTPSPDFLEFQAAWRESRGRWRPS